MRYDAVLFDNGGTLTHRSSPVAAVCSLAAPAIADPVTLHFWVAWDPQQADGIAAKKEIAAYEQAHPGVKIDVQNITYDALHDKLLTALADVKSEFGLPDRYRNEGWRAGRE